MLKFTQKKPDTKTDTMRHINEKKKDQISKKAIMQEIRKRRIKKAEKNPSQKLSFSLNHLEEYKNNPELITKIKKWLHEPPSLEIEKYIEFIKSNEIQRQHFGLIFLRKLVQNKKEHFQRIYDEDIITKIINHTKNNYYPHLQLESSWILANLAGGSSKQTFSLIQKNIIKIFENLLKNKFIQIVEQALWGIGNISGDSNTTFNLVLITDIISLLDKIYKSNFNEKIRNTVIWIFTNLLRIKEKKVINKKIGVMINLAIFHFCESNNTESLEECILGIVPYLKYKHLKLVKNEKFFAKLFFFFNFLLGKNKEKINVVIYILRLLTKISASHEESDLKLISQNNFFDKFKDLLEIENLKIKSYVCLIISNFCVNNLEFWEYLIQNTILFNKIIFLTNSKQNKIVNEALTILCNLSKIQQRQHFEFYINKNILLIFLKILDEEETNNCLLIFSALENLLEFSKNNNIFQDFIKILFTSKIAEKIEELQQHANYYVYYKAVNLLENYFCLEDPYFN